MSQTESTKDVNVNSAKDFDWNHYEYDWYKENGFDYKNETLEDSTLNHSERAFLSQYDASKGPIKRHITKLIRVEALDLLEADRNKTRPVRKEFLIVIENWEAKGFLGQEIRVNDHRNGIYPRMESKDIVDGYDQRGLPRIIGRRPENKGDNYYIPYSKETVDEWIDKSYSTDRESIMFCLKEPPNRVYVNYDQFLVDWGTAKSKFINPPKEKPSEDIKDLKTIIAQQSELITKLLEAQATKKK